MTFQHVLRGGCAVLALGLAAPALADTAPAPAPAHFGDPVSIGDGVTFDPMLDARLRWEDVDAAPKSADAVTLRTRLGFEVKDQHSHLSFLAEAVGTLALDKGYSAFPYAVPAANNQYRPALATIADPQTLGLNRVQIQYATKALTVTLGRQRINQDDQRFVGSVGWRQNEQTFDAVRVEARRGVFNLDATYADRQNTIYGADGNPRDFYSGKFVFVNGGIKDGGSTLKGFAYLLDYDRTSFINLPNARSQLDSSQTYGVRIGQVFPFSKTLSLALSGSYARQSNYGNNTRAYNVNYYQADAALTVKTQTVSVGYELMGADARATGGTWSMQTPMATLHAFDGWADLFLTTPTTGLGDTHIGLAGKYPKLKALPGLSYAVSYHWFGSDVNNTKFGNEIDASVGIKTHRVSWLAKYANYTAKGFGVNTQKFWLEADYAF